MSFSVEILNKRDRWGMVGPVHGTEEQALLWIEKHKRESWMNWRVRDLPSWFVPKTRLQRQLRDDEWAWKVEALCSQRWETVGSLHDTESEALAWARENRCDWWEDWQVIHVVPDNRIRFDRKWLPEPNSGCWLWMGAHNGQKGVDLYGFFGYDGITIGSHRASWQLYRGEIPDGLVVRHKCDTPCCVNPDHLKLGTQLDNIQDAIDRRRHSCGEKHAATIRGIPHPTTQGQNHRRATLTDKDVIAIRQLASSIPHRELSIRFNTSIANIRSIVYRKSWKHL